MLASVHPVVAPRAPATYHWSGALIVRCLGGSLLAASQILAVLVGLGLSSLLFVAPPGRSIFEDRASLYSTCWCSAALCEGPPGRERHSGCVSWVSLPDRIRALTLQLRQSKCHSTKKRATSLIGTVNNIARKLRCHAHASITAASGSRQALWTPKRQGSSRLLSPSGQKPGAPAPTGSGCGCQDHLAASH